MKFGQALEIVLTLAEQNCLIDSEESLIEEELRQKTAISIIRKHYLSLNGLISDEFCDFCGEEITFKGHNCEAY